MEIQHSDQDGCLVVGFTGSIDLFSVTQVRKTLLKDLSTEPYALICDLSGVENLDPVCATVFSTVANHPASRWPATAFLLCGAQPPVAAILGRLQVPHFLQLYADVDEAIDQAVARPPYLREELRLAPTPTASAAARTFVRETCRYWQLALPDATVMERAVLLANELVTNAVEHGRGSAYLDATVEVGAIRLEVTDSSTVEPQPNTAVSDLDERGRGLMLIDALASRWGVRPQPDGKTVWCELDLATPQCG
jgi:anti-anti-sigma regulatory factor/anti-sigma regulatory factor (Ser/Thr protein kinase)